jgi:putative transferase (TIGR04331 family)
MSVNSEIANPSYARADGLFLAATSLKSAWPVERPDVFLGDWCFRFPEDKQLAQRARLAAYPWVPAEMRIRGSEFCQQLTRRIAMGLASFFSNLFHEELDERGAILLLGPPAAILTGIAYHQFLCIKGAIEQYGPLRSVGLCREDYLAPETTERFMREYWHDGCQLQFFSAICPQLGIPLTLYSRQELAAELNGAAAMDGSKALPRSSGIAGGWLLRMAKSLLRFASRQAPCVLYRSSFSPAEMLTLAGRSALQILPIPRAKLELLSWPRQAPDLRRELRVQLASILNATPFEKALGEILPAAWPVSLLEGSKTLRTAVAREFPRAPKTIVTAEACTQDDAFRLWCVQSLKRGSRLVACQHGGGYGMRLPISLGEQFEYAVADKFISWGASVKARSCVALPVPPHFVARHARPADGHLLYVGTTAARWPITMDYGPMGPMFLQYLDRQTAFLRALPPDLRSQLLLRPNPDEAGWSELKRVRESIPQLTIDDFSRSFTERLGEAKLVVVDNYATTYIQSMGSGVPTVLVWDPDVWIMNDDVKACFDDLEAAGVYFRSARAAVAAVERIWRNPQAWWEEPRVAAAVNRLLDKFFKTDRHWSRPWLSELLA